MNHSTATSYDMYLPFMDGKTMRESVLWNNREKLQFLSSKPDVVNVEIGCPFDFALRDSAMNGEAYNMSNAHKDELVDFMDYSAFNSSNHPELNDYELDHDLLFNMRLERGWIVILICDLPNGLRAGMRFKIFKLHRDFILCRSIGGAMSGVCHCIRRVTIGLRIGFPVSIDLTANILKMFGPLCLTQEQYDRFIALEYWRYNGQIENFTNYNDVKVEGYVAGTMDHLLVIYLNRFQYILNSGKYYVVTVKQGLSA